jgi:phage terminase small subunit
MGKDGLSDKQKRFCEEYVIDHIGSQAAIRCGYSAKTAEVQAARLLTYAKVKKYISELQSKISAKNEDLAQQVIDELAKLAFSNAQDFVNGGNTILEIKHLDRNKTAAVSKIKTTVKGDGDIVSEIAFHSKPQALEQLGRHLGIFEKDNKQKGSEIVIPEIKVYNSAPPLAGDENDIEA